MVYFAPNIYPVYTPVSQCLYRGHFLLLFFFLSLFSFHYDLLWASQVALVVKNLPASVGDIRDLGLIPGSGRFPGGGSGNPLQYSRLENSHGQRSLAGYSAWGHKSWTRISD